jgi:hypothetical protein
MTTLLSRLRPLNKAVNAFGILDAFVCAFGFSNHIQDLIHIETPRFADLKTGEFALGS